MFFDTSLSHLEENRSTKNSWEGNITHTETTLYGIFKTPGSYGYTLDASPGVQESNLEQNKIWCEESIDALEVFPTSRFVFEKIKWRKHSDA